MKLVFDMGSFVCPSKDEAGTTAIINATCRPNMVARTELAIVSVIYVSLCFYT